MNIEIGDLFTIKKLDRCTSFLKVGEMVESTMKVTSDKLNKVVTVKRLDMTEVGEGRTNLVNVLMSQLAPLPVETQQDGSENLDIEKTDAPKKINLRW